MASAVASGGSRGLVWRVLAVAALVRAAIAALLPVVKDEAYYLHWSQALDLGYFDHPPAVAWIGATSRLWPSSAAAARLGALAVGLLATPLCAGLFRRAGLTDRRALLAALVLVTFNVGGILYGVLVTPDTVFFVAWCAMLHEAAAALDGHPRRWLTTGLAIGAGLLSKYVMVLAFPVVLWAIARSRPRALATRWPWLGLAAAVLTFAPHIVWNARNDWVPMRFQLQQAFVGSELDLGNASTLPAPVPARPEELALARPYGPPHKKRKTPVPWPLRSLQTSSGYAGALLGIWGLLAVPVLLAAAGHLRSRRPRARPLRAEIRPLLVASVIVPAGFFGLVSLKTLVEANWPGVYIVGAAALLAGGAARHPRWLLAGAAANAAVLLTLAWHGHHPLAATTDRVLRETHGHRELAQEVARYDGPILFGRHQTGGMLGFYLPGRPIAQWPGVQRPSEFVRRAAWNPWTVEDLVRAGGFLLVTTRPSPPGLPGFRAAAMDVFVACSERGGSSGHRLTRDGPHESPCPGHELRRWSLIRYVPEP